MITWMRKHMKTIMIAVAVLFVVSIFYGLGGGGFRSDSTPRGGKKHPSAKINGKELDAYRYQQIFSRLMSSYKVQDLSPSDLAFLENLSLNQAVDFTLVLQEARRRVRVSRQELDGTMNNIIQTEKFPSKKEFEQALKRMGMDLAKFKTLLKDEILVQKMATKVREEVKVKPEDLREIRASHILLTDEATAKKIFVSLNKGENFGKLAREFSADPGSKEKSGDLGFFTVGMMVEPFEKAAFSLKPGEVSQVVKSPFGFHIIKLSDSRLRKFAGQEKDIEKAALAQKQETAFRRWYSEIRGKAKIEIVDPVFRGHSARFSGRGEEALAEYKKAISENPANAYLYLYLADTYDGLGKSELALSQYEKALQIESGNPYLYLVLGNAYRKQKNNAQALVQYQKASLIASDNKSLHEKLLAIFKEMGSSRNAAREQAEIRRIEKREKFEKELKGEK